MNNPARFSRNAKIILAVAAMAGVLGRFVGAERFGSRSADCDSCSPLTTTCPPGDPLFGNYLDVGPGSDLKRHANLGRAFPTNSTR